MRKATLFWLGMATVCGTLLFHTSQEVTDGRGALRRMEREVLREEESLRVLQAEWSYLNQPERLEKLARDYLGLAPLNGRQFIRVSDLNERIDDDALAAAHADAPDPAIPSPPPPPAAIEPAAGSPRPAPAAKPAPRPVTAPRPVPTAAHRDTPPAPPPVPAAAAPAKAPARSPVAAPSAHTSSAPAPSAPARPAPARAFDDVLKNLGAD